MDICVTVPKAFWHDWVDEGDLPDEPYDGRNEYHFFGRGHIPDIKGGERVYIVAHGQLRGYAPLVRIDTLANVRHGPFLADIPDWWWTGATYGLVRHGGAVAVTIPEPIRGFQGWRYVWWSQSDEVPFPDWMDAGVSP